MKDEMTTSKDGCVHSKQYCLEVNKQHKLLTAFIFLNKSYFKLHVDNVNGAKKGGIMEREKTFARINLLKLETSDCR